MSVMYWSPPSDHILCSCSACLFVSHPLPGTNLLMPICTFFLLGRALSLCEELRINREPAGIKTQQQSKDPTAEQRSCWSSCLYVLSQQSTESAKERAKKKDRWEELPKLRCGSVGQLGFFFFSDSSYSLLHPCLPWSYCTLATLPKKWLLQSIRAPPACWAVNPSN